ncbi:MAG: hypothetical protein ACRECY_19820, partial [Phyllobacterium sp.]
MTPRRLPLVSLCVSAIVLGLAGSLWAAPPKLPLHGGRPLTRIGDNEAYSPPDPLGKSRPAPEDPDIVRAIEQRLRTRFAAAAGPSQRLLTARQALDASWGFVSDHFAEIDRDRDGFVTLADISTFMEGRS